MLPAAEAHSAGLVQRVVPDGHARSAALESAAKVAENAPFAVQQAKVLTRGHVYSTLLFTGPLCLRV